MNKCLRICSRCNKEILYKDIKYKKKADKRNGLCKECIMKDLHNGNRKYKDLSEKNANRRKVLRDRIRNGDFHSMVVYLKDRAQKGALRRGYRFNLSIEYLKELYNKQGGRCYYTGVKLIMNKVTKNIKEIDIHGISIDRIDNNKGYTEGNVVLCTVWSNYAKHVFSEEQFYKECEEAIRYNNYKKEINIK